MVIGRLLKLAAVVASLWLVGCQSYQTTPVTSSPGSKGERPGEPAEVPTTGREPHDRDVITSPPAQQRPHTAIAALEDKALEYVARQQWQEAIESAEHGLRLDRRYASFYRVLGESYKALGDTARAAGFARQALRFCGQNCSAAEILMQSLDSR